MGASWCWPILLCCAYCILRLRRTDNRPGETCAKLGVGAADSRCHPMARRGGLNYDVRRGGGVGRGWVCFFRVFFFGVFYFGCVLGFWWPVRVFCGGTTV